MCLNHNHTKLPCKQATLRLIAYAYWIWSLNISSSNFQLGRSHPYWKYTFLYFLSSMDANCHTGNLSWKYTAPGYLQDAYPYWICWHSVKSAFSLRMHATTFDTFQIFFFRTDAETQLEIFLEIYISRTRFRTRIRTGNILLLQTGNIQILYIFSSTNAGGRQKPSKFWKNGVPYCIS